MLNAAPARPPSGLKQNGTTSERFINSFDLMFVCFGAGSSDFPLLSTRLQRNSSRELHRFQSKHTEPITRQPAFVANVLDQSAVSVPPASVAVGLQPITGHFRVLVYLFTVVPLLLLPGPRRMDNGPSLISSITLPPSSPSPSFSDSTPGGSSLLNGPHSYSQTPEVLKVSSREGGRMGRAALVHGSGVSLRYLHHYT